MVNDIILISEDYIKNNSGLMQNVDNQFIVAHINEAQNIDYRTLIGKTLYNRVITEFTAWKAYQDANPSGSDPITDYVSQVIIDLVDESQPYLMYRVLSNSNYSLAAKMTNKGTVEQSSDYSNTADKTLVNNMEVKYASRASSFGVQLLEFINDNAADYPEYSTDCTSVGVDTQYLYLGDE